MTVQILAEWPPPYKVARSLEDAEKCARWMGTQKPVLAVDTESAGLYWWRDPLRLVQLSDGKTTWVVPARYAGPVVARLEKYLDGRTRHPRRLVFANAKYDTHVLRSAPLALEHTAPPGSSVAAATGLVLPWDRIEDVQAKAAVLFPGEPKDLKTLGEEHVDPMGDVLYKWLKRIFTDRGWSMESGAKKPLGWAHIEDDNEVYLAYSAWDAWSTAHMAIKFEAQLTEEQRRVHDLDRGATGVLARMETRGARIDRAYCRTKATELTEHVAAAEASIQARYGVDPSSNAEVGAYLTKAGVDLPLTEGGAPSVKAEALELVDHPLAVELLDVRHAAKYLSYFQGMLDNAGDGDVMHPSINPNGARTGRMSVSEPPLQQLPRLALIRDAVIPRDGNVLAASDYDQIEMRLLAHFLSVAVGDDTMLEAIAVGDRRAATGEAGYDLHSMNARTIYGIDVDAKVPKKLRTLAKNGGFAKVYGAGPAKFAATVNKGLPPEEHLTEADGRAFIDSLEATFPGLRPFTRAIENAAKRREREGGLPWIKAPSGRTHVARPGKCLSHDKCSMACDGRQRLYFQLPNYLIQGTAAKLFKEGLVRLDRAGLADELILPVHDEAIADVPRADAPEYVRAMAAAMSDRESFRVPLTADGKLVERWGEGYE